MTGRFDLLVGVARLGTRSPRRALVVALFLAVAAGLFGSSVAGHLSVGGLNDPGSPSSRADTFLRQRFGESTANFVLLVRSRNGVDSPSARLAGVVLTATLAEQPHVSNVISYWLAPSADRARLASRDLQYALVAATVRGSDTQAPTRAAALGSQLAGDHNGVFVQAGGQAETSYQINRQISHDLGIAEAIAVPLTLVALVLVFGSPIAALLPLSMGAVSVVGGLAVLRLLTLVTSVSIYGLNLATAMGLGLGIDYSLFILNRYREELARGRHVVDAVHCAVRTAGRTVCFSGGAVALSMISLLVFPFYLLRSFAYAGLAVVVISAASAMVVLPALLCLLGRRVNVGDVGAQVRRLAGLSPIGRSGGRASLWHRLATVVMRWPVVFGAAVLCVLAVLGSPFLSVRFGLPDYRVLPPGTSSYRVGHILQDDFTANEANALTVAIPKLGRAGSRQLRRYAGSLSLLKDVNSVASPEGTYVNGRRVPGTATPISGGSTYLVLQDDVSPYSPAGGVLVAAVRAAPAPAPALVTGLAAASADALGALGGDLPYAIALIAASTFLILLLFTRSLLVPVKALVLNVLSLSATFGVMVWVFQDGHLSWLLGPLHATGYLEAVMPVLMFCIAFGVSMDYEVFLVSRIKEEWDRSDYSAQANTAAVVLGLERTGPIVTAAAALLSIVFIAFATSQINFIKMLGTGLALAVLMDATLVRGVLVPAFMKIAGRANWWAPSWLSRTSSSIGHAFPAEGQAR